MKFRKYSTDKKGDDGAKLSVAEGARSSDREKGSAQRDRVCSRYRWTTFLSLSLSLSHEKNRECWNNTMNIRIIHTTFFNFDKRCRLAYYNVTYILVKYINIQCACC